MTRAERMGYAPPDFLPLPTRGRWAVDPPSEEGFQPEPEPDEGPDEEDEPCES